MAEAEGEKPREAQLGEGPEAFAAFTFTPSVLCDLGQYLYSLNKLGSGSLLANALHMYVARNNETLHELYFVLEGQTVQTIYFRRMA